MSIEELEQAKEKFAREARRMAAEYVYDGHVVDSMRAWVESGSEPTWLQRDDSGRYTAARSCVDLAALILHIRADERKRCADELRRRSERMATDGYHPAPKEIVLIADRWEKGE